MADKLNSDSHNIIETKRKKLNEILPGAVKEGKIDVEELKKIIGEEGLELGNDKYDFSWAGQEKAYKEIKNTTRKTLKPQRDQSVNFDETENIFIEGENLDTLKTLQRAYSGEVKMIYIDPPYNTGNDFVYNDDFSQSKEEYEKKTGQRDEEGKLVANTKTNGRFHSDWLTMMYPRLFMARNMLKEDGVIFVSIGDTEVHNLRMIMNEIFGEENFIANICHKSRASVSNDKIISDNHDHILLYAKDKTNIFENRHQFGLEKDFEDFEKEDERGRYKLVPVSGPGGKRKGNPHYEFRGVEGYFRYSKETMKELYEDNKVVKKSNSLYKKYYVSDAKEKRQTDTTWWDDAGLTSTATSDLKKLMGDKVFNNPKPVSLVKRMIEISCSNEDSPIVMDFFAGSATTAQAVLESNLNAKFITIQLDEEVNEDSVAAEEGYETVSEIATDRITKVIENIESSKDLEDFPEGSDEPDIGYKYFSLEDTNLIQWSSPEDVEQLKEQMRLQENPWKPDSDKESVIFEILLKEGFTPNAEISEVEELSSTHRVEEDERELFICLEDEVEESIVDGLEIESETKFVCKDSALSDTSKQNLSEKVNLKAI